MTGCLASEQLLIDCYFGRTDKIPSNAEASALVVDNGELFTVLVTEETGFQKCPERHENPLSIGSGSHHALTAMDMGATAKEAVRMAIKRDSNSGGTIRTFRVKR